jgi:uncharacterized phage protein (TIGR01671 family)
MHDKKYMSREILFRGKVADLPNSWVYGYLVREDTIYQCDKQYFNGFCGLGTFSVKPETVGQFIELNDINGTKIFEGDILMLRVPDHNNNGAYNKEYWCIRYNADLSRYEATLIVNGYNPKETCRWSLYDNLAVLIFHYEGEIAGNIYDNPELLSVGGKNDK